MTSMENAIEQAAQVMARAYFGEPVEHDMVCAIEWARALAEAGLLAPAPLREEWGVQWDDHDIWGHYLNRDEATVGAGDEGTPVHRWITDWEAVE